jgi:thioesterase domain-containing protein
METGALISLLRERNVKLSVDDGQLKVSAPPGVFDAELRATLAGRKQDILAFLKRAEDLRARGPALVPVKSEGSKPPIFGVSGHGADAYYLVSLARLLDAEQPVLSVEPKGLDGSGPLESLEALARFEIEAIRRFRPDGPYLIAGHCSGGILAFEVARQLTAAGQDVALVAMIGTPSPSIFKRLPQLRLRAGRHLKGLFSGSLEDRKHYIKSRLERRRTASASEANPEVLAARKRVEAATMDAVRRYEPYYYPGQIDLFVTSDERHQAGPWRTLARVVREHDLTKFSRDELLLGSYASALAAPLRERLAAGSMSHSEVDLPQERALYQQPAA